MCGIVGWLDYNHDLTLKEHILDKMVDTMAGRGPDARGTWLTREVGIGHRRLSVIDPENGAQPMMRNIGGRTFVITYNGELYNMSELKNELESLGHIFLTNCDTEVLLVSYIEWGENCVDKFNGIFAFGIWDDYNKSLFLARDRFGVKPLFYYQTGTSLLFASELKALLANPLVPHEIDKEGLFEILGLGPSRTPGYGVFKGIKELKPGWCMSCSDEHITLKPYWQLESRPHYDDFNTTVEKVRYLITDSIKRQLVSDVPLCTFLSGGLDSSAITAIAAEEFNKKGQILETYAIDYIGNGDFFKPTEFQPNSDAHWINIVSDKFYTHHHNYIVTNELLASSLRQAVLARDLPGMADIDSSLLLFCSEIKKDFTVALSGECADEIFGGYPWFHSPESSKDTFPWIRSVDEKLDIFSDSVINKNEAKDYIQQRYSDTLSEVPRLIGEDPIESRRRDLFYLNMAWFMATLLDRKDRMSMACGLEVRVPYCDHRIVEYVWNIPWEMKSCGGREKGIMREALKGILPDSIIERKKSPYPKTHNLEYSEIISKNLLEILKNKNSPVLNILNKDKAQILAQSKGEAFQKPWYGQLMTGPQLIAYLIQMDIWMREYNVNINL